MHDSPAAAPTVRQGVVGTLLLLGFAAIPLGWSEGEIETGNRLFLWGLTTLLTILALWRGLSTARAAVHARRFRRPLG